MFKVFIAENILKNIIQAESQRPNNSRSDLFKILKSAKNLYVAMDALKQIISTLRKISNSLSSPYIMHDSYYYAVNGEWMGKCLCFRNRLIK